MCVSAPFARRSSARLQGSTQPGLGELGCVCQRHMLRKAAAAQGLPPPGLWELAGVCVSAACSEKQRLLSVSHCQGSGSWRVCVCQRRLVYGGLVWVSGLPSGRCSMDDAAIEVARRYYISNLSKHRRCVLGELAPATQGLPPPGL